MSDVSDAKTILVCNDCGIAVPEDDAQPDCENCNAAKPWVRFVREENP